MVNLIRQLIVSVAVLAVIVVNILANALPLNGLQTGEIADRFDLLFIPADYAFSIWGLIYAGLIAYTIYQAAPAQRDVERVRRIDGPVLLSCLANVGWLFAWHYEQFVLSVGIMLLLFGALLSVYLRLDRGREDAAAAQRWLVDLPFSIYLGWISVATLTNIGVVLEFLDWGGWGVDALLWFVVGLVVALGLAGVLAWGRRDVACLAVFVWAFVGIAVAQRDRPEVVIAAAAAALIALAMVIASVMDQRRGRPGVKWAASSSS